MTMLSVVAVALLLSSQGDAQTGDAEFLPDCERALSKARAFNEEGVSVFEGMKSPEWRSYTAAWQELTQDAGAWWSVQRASRDILRKLGAAEVDTSLRWKVADVLLAVARSLDDMLIRSRRSPCLQESMIADAVLENEVWDGWRVRALCQQPEIAWWMGHAPWGDPLVRYVRTVEEPGRYGEAFERILRCWAFWQGDWKEAEASAGLRPLWREVLRAVLGSSASSQSKKWTELVSGAGSNEAWLEVWGQPAEAEEVWETWVFCARLSLHLGDQTGLRVANAMLARSSVISSPAITEAVVKTVLERGKPCELQNGGVVLGLRTRLIAHVTAEERQLLKTLPLDTEENIAKTLGGLTRLEASDLVKAICSLAAVELMVFKGSLSEA